MAQIDAPRLSKVVAMFVEPLVSADISQLSQFIGQPDNFQLLNSIKQISSICNSDQTDAVVKLCLSVDMVRVDDPIRSLASFDPGASCKCPLKHILDLTIPKFGPNFLRQQIRNFRDSSVVRQYFVGIPLHRYERDRQYRIEDTRLSLRRLKERCRLPCARTHGCKT